MKSKGNNQQMTIPFDEAIWRIDIAKEERRNELLLKTHYFQDKPEELEFLLKITYDITDKDFEYLCKYILEKGEHYTNLEISKDDYMKGEDINGYNEKGLPCSIQCKQWVNLYIDIKKAGEYFAQTFSIRKRNPEKHFIYITTSYLEKEAQEFFIKYKIVFIHNTKLVQICKKIGLLENENWSKFIIQLKQDRLKKLTTNNQSGGLKDLKKIRLQELTHHLPKYMYPDNIAISGTHIKESHPFFKYWNLT